MAHSLVRPVLLEKCNPLGLAHGLDEDNEVGEENEVCEENEMDDEMDKETELDDEMEKDEANMCSA